VHGGGAHAHWWTHVAARFSDDFRVVAVDLSGHGDSAHRSEYSLERWTEEVVAAAEAGGISGPPVVIGTAWAASSPSRRPPGTQSS